MKTLRNGFLVAMVALTAALAACGQKDANNGNGNDGGTVVEAIPNNINVVPTSSQCLNPNSSYAGSDWSPYQQAGFYQPTGSYGSQYYGRHGRNSRYAQQQQQQVCPANTYPACDGRVGLVCVPATYGANNNLAWYGYNGNQFNFCGYNQYQGYSSGWGNNSCTNSTYSPVGQTCIVGQNSCGYGTCSQVSYGSSIGICTR